MSSLRKALEELARERDSVSGHTASDYYIRPYELLDLLAAHPAPVADRDQVVAEFVAQREEYVRVLKQCVNADADYYRWQGHAEARRQLRDKLAACEVPAGDPS